MISILPLVPHCTVLKGVLIFKGIATFQWRIKDNLALKMSFLSKNDFAHFNDPFKKSELKSFSPSRNYTSFNDFSQLLTRSIIIFSMLINLICEVAGPGQRLWFSVCKYSH